jgi:uncharacterized membrane protein
MIALVAVLIALTTVFTLVVRIPTPAKGYANLSDVVITFASLIFGPWVGMVTGGVGAALADLIGGYAFFAPLSLVAHGLEGLLIGLIMWRQPSGRWIKVAWLVGALATMVYGLAGPLLMVQLVAGSKVEWWIVAWLAGMLAIGLLARRERPAGRMVVVWLASALAMVAYGLVGLLLTGQFVAGHLVGWLIVLWLAGMLVIGLLVWRPRSEGWMVAAWSVGALAMVAVYLVGEGLVYTGWPLALAELPFNVVQALVGGVVGIRLVLAVRKAYPPVDRIGQRSTWTEE